jgi:aryl-alcohol dehydrogenase-like predicted oxidoreductase
MSVTRLILGTAQLGLAYGIANHSGKPDRAAAVSLIHQALNAGVTVLDTAHCYGDSEQVVCQALASTSQPAQVITKIDTPLAKDAATLDDAALAMLAETGVRASCAALQRDTLPVLLIREAWPLRRDNGFWNTLVRLRDQGVIGTLGLSAQAPEEADLAAACPAVGHLQIPFNLLDYRWREGGTLARLAARPDMTVHVRSVFLQGLLTGGATTWPAVAEGCGPAIIRALTEACARIERASLADLCLSYVLSHPQFSGVVLGMETAAQLADNLSLIRCPPLRESQRHALDTALPRVPAALLNPGLW